MGFFSKKKKKESKEHDRESEAAETRSNVSRARSVRSVASVEVTEETSKETKAKDKATNEDPEEKHEGADEKKAKASDRSKSPEKPKKGLFGRLFAKKEASARSRSGSPDDSEPSEPKKSRERKKSTSSQAPRDDASSDTSSAEAQPTRKPSLFAPSGSASKPDKLRPVSLALGQKGLGGRIAPPTPSTPGRIPPSPGVSPGRAPPSPAMQHLQSISRRKPGDGSVPPTPVGRQPSPLGTPLPAASILGSAILQQVMNTPRGGVSPRGTPRGVAASPRLAATPTTGARGRGGGLDLSRAPSLSGFNKQPSFLGTPLLRKQVSLPGTPVTGGRGGGLGPAVLAGLTSSLAQSMLHSSARSMGVASVASGGFDQDAYIPGKAVFIKAGSNGCPPARGIIVEPQGDSVIIRPDPPWETSHPEGPYEKVRLRLLPPLTSSVEVKDHSNSALNGRTGRVVEYDSKPPNPRPGGVRVLLNALGDKPQANIMFNFINLRKGPVVAQTPQLPHGQPPRSPKVDPLKRLYNALTKDRGTLSCTALVHHLQDIGSKNGLVNEEAEEALKMPIDTFVQFLVKSRSPSKHIDHNEFMQLAAEACRENERARELKLQEDEQKRLRHQEAEQKRLKRQGDAQNRSNTVQQENKQLGGDEEAKKREESEQRKREQQRAQDAAAALQAAEVVRLQLEEQSKRHQQQVRESQLQGFLQSLQDEETAARLDKEDAERATRASAKDRFDDNLRSVHALLQQKHEITAAKQELLALHQQFTSLKSDRIAPPGPSGPSHGHEAAQDGKARRHQSRSSVVSAVSSSSSANNAPEKPPAKLVKSRVKKEAKPGPQRQSHSPDQLWADFTSALLERGASVAELSHATEDQLLSILTDTLGFSKLDGLRVVKQFLEKFADVREAHAPAISPKLGSSKRVPQTPPQPTLSPRRQSGSAVEPASDATGDEDGPSANHSNPPPKESKHKGRKKLLDPLSQEYTMVAEVLRLTTTCGDCNFRVQRVTQLTPVPNVLSRYDKSRSRLGSAVQKAKVLYYTGATLPSLSEVMQSGFDAELRRSKSLQFSTEANIENAAGQGGEVVLLLLCEVLSGRVQRIPQSSSASFHRQVTKYCGLPHPQRDANYSADSVAMDYNYVDMSGETRKATKYALNDPSRVIPRYLVSLLVTESHSNKRTVMLSPTTHSGVSMLPREVSALSPGSPLVSGRALNQLHNIFQGISPSHVVSRSSGPVMCPLHPGEELQLYCVDDEELTCTMCASVGRHSGKKCQPLSELLQGMRSHLAVHEKQVSNKLARVEAGLNQLQKQADTVRDAEIRARRQIRQRTNELIEEVSGRREALEHDLTTKAVDAGAKVQEAIRHGLEHAVSLRQAHEKIKTLVDDPYSKSHGISGKAADIIALSKLLEKVKGEQGSVSFLNEYALGMSLTEDIHTELSRLRLPPPSITSFSYYSSTTPRMRGQSPSQTPVLSATSPRMR
ncbi:hypothetical protein DIPPA_18734 [Diplonema papillatum]|nr:hypothetical protein DIPPA_18734 [Diplonema papillatum]KAJ9465352.1 hypothetical protein DIPPA_18734 [Diplonema papillatum]